MAVAVKRGEQRRATDRQTSSQPLSRSFLLLSFVSLSFMLFIELKSSFYKGTPHAPRKGREKTPSLDAISNVSVLLNNNTDALLMA